MIETTLELHSGSSRHWLNPELCEEMREFNTQIKEKIGNFDDSLILQSEVDEPEEALVVPLPDGELPVDEDGYDEPETGRGFDPLVQAEVILPHKGGDMMAKVVGRKRDAAGNLVGRKHKLPVLDSRVYEVEFLDGECQEVSFNILAEHLLSQFDEEGNQYHIFKEIVDHHKNPKKAVDKADQYLTKGNRKYKRKTTVGGFTSRMEGWYDFVVTPEDVKRNQSCTSGRVCQGQSH